MKKIWIAFVSLHLLIGRIAYNQSKPNESAVKDNTKETPVTIDKIKTGLKSFGI